MSSLEKLLKQNQQKSYLRKSPYKRSNPGM